jgi:hypothetical protein
MTQACTSTSYNSAFQTMVDELQKLNPDIKRAIIFKYHGTILAKDKDTTEQSANKFIQMFNEIEDKTQKIGGLQSLTVFGTKREISVSNVNGMYLTTIYTKQADKRTIELLTKVLVPTVVKFLDQLAPSSKPDAIMSELIPPLANDNDSEIKESLNSEKIEQIDIIVTKEPILSTPNTGGESQPQQFIIDEEDARILDLRLGPTEQARSTYKLAENPNNQEIDDNKKIQIPKKPENELTVERLDNLFVRPNTIRVDKELIAKWKTDSQKKKLERITLESPDKRTAICKFEPITDKKYLGKGLIQVPENIQRALGVTLGTIVLTKPIISEE